MKTNSKNPKEDLQAIRNMMERSTKFLSLSGLSGIFAGLCALIGVAAAWFLILNLNQITFGDYLFYIGSSSSSDAGLLLVLDAVLVLVFAVLGAIYFSFRKARKSGQKFWTKSTRQLLVHLIIPLVSGAFFILILFLHHNLALIPSAMLVFYGLSLVNAGKFTFGEIHYLGLTEIALGILAGFFVNLGLVFWAIGFGVMHLVYGSVMYFRHERE